MKIYKRKQFDSLLLNELIQRTHSIIYKYLFVRARQAKSNKLGNRKYIDVQPLIKEYFHMRLIPY
jgi:hypothetical protein